MEEYGKEEKDDVVETLAALRQAEVPYETLVEQHMRISGWADPLVLIYYTIYQAKDDVIAIACLSDNLREKAAKAIGVTDPRFSGNFKPTKPLDSTVVESLSSEIKEIMLTKSGKEWLAIFDAAGVPAGPVRFVQELTSEEQVIANDMIVEVNHKAAGKVRMAGPMISMSATPLKAQFASPALGEHTYEILSELGFDDREISHLKSQNIVQ